MSKLSAIYAELVEHARKLNADQATTLRNGARIAVGFRYNAEMQAVTFSRVNAPVGEDELKTFQRHCSIPATAERIPPAGQDTLELENDRVRYSVSYKWMIEPEQQLDLLQVLQ